MAFTARAFRAETHGQESGRGLRSGSDVEDPQLALTAWPTWNASAEDEVAKMSGIKRSAVGQWFGGPLVGAQPAVARSRLHPWMPRATSAMPRPSTSSTLCNNAAASPGESRLGGWANPNAVGLRHPSHPLRVSTPQPGGGGKHCCRRCRPQSAGAQWQPAAALCGAAGETADWPCCF